MFFLFGLMFMGPIMEQYVYKSYSDQFGFNYTIGETSENNCPTDEPRNSTDRILQKKVHLSQLNLEVFWKP